jgi:hypothetical protein
MALKTPFIIIVINLKSNTTTKGIETALKLEENEI